MSIQLIWKRLITNKVPLSSPRLSIPFLQLRSLAIDTKITKFCTETPTPLSQIFSSTNATVTDFLINKCGMTENDVSKALRNRKDLLYRSSQDLEEGLELLNECGLTTLPQIRKVIAGNPGVFLYKSQRDLKSRLNLFRSFMKKYDLCKLVCNNSIVLTISEDKLRSAISLLQRWGFEGEALSKLVAGQPRVLTTEEEKVTESFKVAEGLGIEKGSKMFVTVLRGILGVGKEKLDLRLQCLTSLGFSEEQISKLLSRHPWILGFSEKTLRRNVGFMVKSLGFSVDDLISYPRLFTRSLEKRIIPRYRVLKALQYMKVLETESISPTAFNIQNKLFIERYVDRNAESSSTLRDIYCGGKAGIVDNSEEDFQ